MTRWIVTAFFLVSLIVALVTVPAPHTGSTLLLLLLLGYSASFVYSVWRCVRFAAHYEGSRRLIHARQTWGELRKHHRAFQNDTLYGVYLKNTGEPDHYNAVLFPFPMGPSHPLPDETPVNLIMAKLPAKASPNDWFHMLTAGVAIGLFFVPWETYVPPNSWIRFVPIILLALGALMVVCDSAGRRFQQRTPRVSKPRDMKYVTSVLTRYERGTQGTHINSIVSSNGVLLPRSLEDDNAPFTVDESFIPRSQESPLPGPLLRKH